MSCIFGPVSSRRFGLSLGVDLSPGQKSCNFDCLYCELFSAKPVDTIINPPAPTEVIQETREALEKFPDVQVITITANGEPTLYPFLDELIQGLNAIKGKRKLLILSNGSTIMRTQIQESLKKLDIVKLSLDCATQECFKKLDRPLKGIFVEEIIEGMKEFRKKFIGVFVIEILVVKGINDKIEEMEELNKALQQIQPDRVDLGTIDRPPAYRVEAVSYQKLVELSKAFTNLHLNIVSRKGKTPHPKELSDKEILDTLKHRPFTDEDVASLFDEETRKRFSRLLKEEKIETKNVGNILFYKTSEALGAADVSCKTRKIS